MSQQSRIPTPLGQRIQHLRLTVVPFLVWLGAAALGIYLWLSAPVESTYTGLVIAKETIITSPEDGMIEEVFVSQFDTVEAGQALATLSNATIDAQMLTAESELEALKAEIGAARGVIELNHKSAQLEAATDHETYLSMATLELPAELRAFYDSENALELGILELRLSLGKTELNITDNGAQLEKAHASQANNSKTKAESIGGRIAILEAEAASHRLSIETLEAKLSEGRSRRETLQESYSPPPATLIPEPDFETLLAGWRAAAIVQQTPHRRANASAAVEHH